MPWKKLGMDSSEFIDRQFLPDDFLFDDPMHMSKDDLADAFRHWEDRLASGEDVFAFKAVRRDDVGWETPDIYPYLSASRSNAMPTMAQAEEGGRRRDIQKSGKKGKRSDVPQSEHGYSGTEDDNGTAADNGTDSHSAVEELNGEEARQRHRGDTTHSGKRGRAASKVMSLSGTGHLLVINMH